jgi:hypothetical protein
MSPYALPVPLAQIEGFKKILDLPQKVPYAHKVAYTLAAHAASSTGTEPGQGALFPDHSTLARNLSAYFPDDPLPGNLGVLAGKWFHL